MRARACLARARADPLTARAGYSTPMEINLTVLNVGNSRLAVGSFVAGELGEDVARVPLDDAGAWTAAIRDAWQRVGGRENAAVVAASVNPRVNDAIARAVDEVANRRVVWIGRDIELPIPVLTETPEGTGVDRVLNVAAAYEQIGKACVVVDAGSAVTVDFCDDQGRFVGGAIAPGVRMMLDALHEKTATLPRVPFAVPAEPFGRSTEQAILHGVYHGVRGMVKELVENYATEIGAWPDLIATGGDAAALFTEWELVHAIAPNLTLYGMAMAYANHHIKHGT
jgi:type III pantothenate kinase